MAGTIDLDKYRKLDDETGQFKYFCPDHPDQEFDSSAGWRYHMQKFHGGVTGSDTDAPSTPLSDNAPSKVAARPRKLSAKSRELNEKMNKCCNLAVKHLVDGINEKEQEELGVLRGELFMAILGIEFNFDDKLIAISNKWILVLVLVALYLVPNMPSFKDQMETIKRKIKESRDKDTKTDG